jgi:RNA polymerase sigma factor (sigma-70 family)
MIGKCLDRLAAGDVQARTQLLNCARDRLQHLARKMLRADFDRLRRWEETDDVYQNAMLRLYRALQDVVPETPLHFYRLSAQLIRRELLDLARHYYGAEGPAANHASGVLFGGAVDSSAKQAQQAIDPASRTDDRRDLHECVELLPEPIKTVVDLLVYQELSQAEAATLLGVDVRSVQRYWQKARLHLHQVLRQPD